MERVTIVGMGMGGAGTLTVAALEALRGARRIVGARRLLDALPDGCTDDRAAAVKPADIAAAVTATPACVVMSGDTGFHSGTRRLLPLLQPRYDVTVLPGITTVQYLAAKLGRPWEDVRLVSAHGADCDAVAHVLRGRETFFLTGGTVTPAVIARQLTDAGLGGTVLTVASRLSYPDEAVVTAPARELTDAEFDGLSAVWAEAVPPGRTALGGGIPDGEFVRGDTPMTKREVRAAVAGLLLPEPGDVIWDVGAGTGSVSVELALLHPSLRVFAVERDEDACGLIEANRRKLGAWNVRVVRGRAPEALADLPAPDCAFLGGSGGSLPRCLETILAKNPAARVCLSAATAETLAAGVTALRGDGWTDFAVTQITAARSRTAGPYHMMTGMNPIWLLSARGKG